MCKLKRTRWVCTDSHIKVIELCEQEKECVFVSLLLESMLTISRRLEEQKIYDELRALRKAER